MKDNEYMGMTHKTRIQGIGDVEIGYYVEEDDYNGSHLFIETIKVVSNKDSDNEIDKDVFKDRFIMDLEQRVFDEIKDENEYAKMEYLADLGCPDEV